MNNTSETLTTSALDLAYCNLIDEGWDPQLAYDATVASGLTVGELLGDGSAILELDDEDFIEAAESLY